MVRYSAGFVFVDSLDPSEGLCKILGWAFANENSARVAFGLLIFMDALAERCCGSVLDLNVVVREQGLLWVNFGFAEMLEVAT